MFPISECCIYIYANLMFVNKADCDTDIVVFVCGRNRRMRTSVSYLRRRKPLSGRVEIINRCGCCRVEWELVAVNSFVKCTQNKCIIEHATEKMNETAGRSRRSKKVSQKMVSNTEKLEIE